MKPNAWVLKESDTGRYRCQNLYVTDETYHTNIINASLYGDEETPKKQAEKMNKMAGFEWLIVVPVSMQVVD